MLSISNQTLSRMPELSRLNLASNRFTTTFRSEFFAKNPYLNDIWLGDNPWRCECWGYGLQEFYQYLTVPPARVSTRTPTIPPPLPKSKSIFHQQTNDRAYLRCASPEELQGKNWNVACHEAWHPVKRQMSTVEKVWTFTMVTLILATLNFCIFLSFKKWLRGRAERRREQERLQVIEDAREL